MKGLKTAEAVLLALLVLLFIAVVVLAQAGALPLR